MLCVGESEWNIKMAITEIYITEIFPRLQRAKLLLLVTRKETENNSLHNTFCFGHIGRQRTRAERKSYRHSMQVRITTRHGRILQSWILVEQHVWDTTLLMVHITAIINPTLTLYTVEANTEITTDSSRQHDGWALKQRPWPHPQFTTTPACQRLCHTAATATMFATDRYCHVFNEPGCIHCRYLHQCSDVSILLCMTDTQRHLIWYVLRAIPVFLLIINIHYITASLSNN